MPTTDDLYSPSVDLRYQETIKLIKPIERSTKWPDACRGAANAFLALVGPSMGHHTGDGLPPPGGENRPYKHPMMIGRNVMDFAWKDSRKARWLRLCSAMLGDKDYVSALTALLNLDWCNSALEPDIPELTDRLKRGLDNHIWPLLEQMRPRLVCPLTKRVWETMLPEIEGRRVVDFPPYPDADVPREDRLTRKPIVFRFDGADFMSFFIKPQNHPSRHFLTNRKIDEVGRACEWFLDKTKLSARMPSPAT